MNHCWAISSQRRPTFETDGDLYSWLLRLAIDHALLLQSEIVALSWRGNTSQEAMQRIELGTDEQAGPEADRSCERGVGGSIHNGVSGMGCERKFVTDTMTNQKIKERQKSLLHDM